MSAELEELYHDPQSLQEKRDEALSQVQVDVSVLNTTMNKTRTFYLNLLTNQIDCLLKRVLLKRIGWYSHGINALTSTSYVFSVVTIQKELEDGMFVAFKNSLTGELVHFSSQEIAGMFYGFAKNYHLPEEFDRFSITMNLDGARYDNMTGVIVVDVSFKTKANE